MAGRIFQREVPRRIPRVCVLAAAARDRCASWTGVYRGTLVRKRVNDTITNARDPFQPKRRPSCARLLK